MGIVVIEAGEKSGTLITVEYGLEQGRDIFAIPGNIISSVSKGTNKLIEEGAKIVTSVHDIIEEYNMILNIDNEPLLPNKIELGETEKVIIGILRNNQPISYEGLQILCNLSTSVFNGYIGVLEIKGIIEQLPGKILMMSN